MENEVLLRMENINKAFPGVRAVDDVTFEVNQGEIHALVGENGAGKTTLMNVLTGVLPPDSGKIYFRGQEIKPGSPSESLRMGISMIHQELALIPDLNVGQNIYIGREPRGLLPGTVDWKRLYEMAAEQLGRLNLKVDPSTAISLLSVAQQQMTEIARALSLDADLIIMDEPTSALSGRETEILFEVMRSLVDEGVAIIFITHRLEEVFEVADRGTVLRDGQKIDTFPIEAVTSDDIVSMMVGREVEEMFPEIKVEFGETMLKVAGLSRRGAFEDIDLEVRAGDIVGLAGLVGAGRTDVARALFGIDKTDAGRIWIAGQEVKIDSPQKAIELGMGFVPEDRKEQGLFLNMALRFNVTSGDLSRYSRLGFLDYERMNQVSQTYIERLDIATRGVEQFVRYLSGGNQQKVVIARWLALEPRILILDDPTRGIDVGAKSEIHRLMLQLAQDGVAVLMISSELPEVLEMSTRIVVMHEGSITAEFTPQEATNDAVMRAATGG